MPNEQQIFDAIQHAIETCPPRPEDQDLDNFSENLSTERARVALRKLGYDLLEPCGRGTARYQVIRAIYG